LKRKGMNRKILASVTALLIIVSCISSLSITQAASDEQWVTDYTIYDAQTGQILLKYDATTNQINTLSSIIPGANIKITFTVNVMASGEGKLKLITGLSKPQTGPYWEYSDTYDLGSTFSPNSAETTFNWAAGKFEITLYGKVPPTTSTTTKTFTAVTLSGPTGTALDKLSITATSAEMNNFLTLLAQKQAKLESMKANGIDAGYIELYTNILQTAQTTANSGDIENAITLLNSLNITNEPVSSTVQALFLPLIIITAVIAAIFVALFLRNRGKTKYFQLVVEDQIKDLEGLTMRAAKIDRAMSKSLESIKDRLKSLIGM
jgi:hypothetical protein